MIDKNGKSLEILESWEDAFVNVKRDKKYWQDFERNCLMKFKDTSLKKLKKDREIIDHLLMWGSCIVLTGNSKRHLLARRLAKEEYKKELQIIDKVIKEKSM